MHTVLIYDDLTQLEVLAFGDVAETVVGVLTACELIALQSLVTSLITFHFTLPSKLLACNICRTTRPTWPPKKHFFLQVGKKHTSSTNDTTYYYNLVACTPFRSSPMQEGKQISC